MAWMLRILSKEGVVKTVPLNQRSAKFTVEPNASYELVPPSGGPAKPLSLKRLVKKNGAGQDDLEVIQDGEPILSLTDFFGSDGNVQLLLPNAEVCANDAGFVRVTPKTSFDQITGQVLFNTTDGASCAPAVTTDGLGGMTSLLAGATFLGGAVAVANGLASADSPVVNAVQVNFIGGPALPNHTLEIELYAADGRRLLGTGQLDEQGQITIEVGDYTGVVIVRLIDRDDGPDYLDEVVGEKDLNASLWAMGQIVQANSIVYLNINALTTIAFDKAQLILTEEQVLTPILVTAVNDAVAQAFGLEDVHNTPIIATNSDEFDPTDTSEGELYGQILAYLAGLDAINSGDTQATINAFVGNAPNDGWLEINTVGSTLTAALTDEGDEALFVDGVNQVALPEAYVTGIAFDGAVGFQSALSSQLITGQLNGSLLPGHSLMASLDGGLTWVNLSDMPGVINGSQINWSVNIAGGSLMIFKVIDEAGNQGPVSTQAYEFTGVIPTTTISGLDISNDTGTSATDFVTNASSQTVTGTLSAALGAGEKLYGTVDNGANWIDISSYVTDRSISWTGVTLSGASTLKVEVRNAIGNAGISASQPYDLDTTSPTTTISGLDISNDTGTSATDFVTNASSQTVTGTLSAALGAGEKLYGTVDNGANWIDISSYVTDRSISWTGVTLSGTSTLKVQVRDAAGNVGTAASVNYELDTSAPSTPAAPTSYADDVGSVTSTTSTASSTDDTKPGIVVGANLTTTPTLYVNGVAVSASYDATAGTLTPTNALSAGTYALTYTLKDLAGNESAPSGALNVTVVLAPTTTISALDILSDTGSSASDFITQTAAQTVTGTLSAALGAGEKLYGTVDNGANWIDISSYVTDRSISWTGVTLSGASTLKLEVRDDEDRPGPTASANYEIDNTGPTLSTITDNFSGSANGEITYRFTFDEAVSGFTADDISITAGTKGAFVKVSNTEYTLKVTPPLIGGEITTSVTGSFTDLAGNSGTATVTNLQESTGLTAGQAVIDLGGSNGKLIKPVYVDGKWYYYWDRNGSGTTDGSDTVDHNVLDQIFVNNVSGGVNPGSNTTDIYRYATINGLKIALPTIGNPDFIETSGPYTGLFYETKVFSNSSSDTTNYVIGTAIDNDPAGEINTEYDDLMAIWDAYNTSSSYRSDGLPPDWYPFGYWSATESVFGHAYMLFGSGYVYDSRDDAFGGKSVAVEVIFPV